MTEQQHSPGYEPGRDTGDESAYKVKLEVFNGPLDLLLYLIKRDEIDIYDIPIAHITDEYLKFVEVLKTLDVDFASDFLVMAATLMEIKSRMLLPRTDALEGEDVEEEDPRANLIRELVEYKQFRQRADHLRERAEETSQRFPRQVRRVIGPDGVEMELEEINVWQLMEAFNVVLRQTMANAPRMIVYDDTPMERVMEDIEWRIAESGSLRFTDMIAEPGDRGAIISYFLGLLELTRQKKIRIMQEVDGGEIYVTLRTDTDEPEPDVESGAEAENDSFELSASEPAEASTDEPGETADTSTEPRSPDNPVDPLNHIAAIDDLPPEYDLPEEGADDEPPS